MWGGKVEKHKEQRPGGKKGQGLRGVLRDLGVWDSFQDPYLAA